jgi:hypothetical protein
MLLGGGVFLWRGAYPCPTRPCGHVCITSYVPTKGDRQPLIFIPLFTKFTRIRTCGYNSST